MTTSSEDLKEGAIIPGNDLVLWKRGDRLRWLKASTVISEQADRIQELEREKAELQDKSKAVPLSAYLDQGAQLHAANTEADTLASFAMQLWRLWAKGGAATNAVAEDYASALQIANRRVNGE